MLAPFTSLSAGSFHAINGLLAAVSATAPTSSQSAPPMSAVLILCLCAVAGIATVLVLPGRREASIRTIGGIVLLAAAAIFAATLVRWTAGDARGGMGT